MVHLYIRSQGLSERPLQRAGRGQVGGTWPWPWVPKPHLLCCYHQPSTIPSTAGHNSWSSQAWETGDGVPISQARKQMSGGSVLQERPNGKGDNSKQGRRALRNTYLVPRQKTGPWGLLVPRSPHILTLAQVSGDTCLQAARHWKHKRVERRRPQNGNR